MVKNRLPSVPLSAVTVTRGSALCPLNPTQISTSAGIPSLLFPHRSYSPALSYLWCMFIFPLYLLIHLLLPLDSGVFEDRQGFTHPCFPLFSTVHHTWGTVVVCRHSSSEWIVSVLCHLHLSSDSESTPHPCLYLKHVPKCLVSNLQENSYTEGTCFPDLEVTTLMSAAGSPGKLEQICEEVEVNTWSIPSIPFWAHFPSETWHLPASSLSHSISFSQGVLYFVL